MNTFSRLENLKGKTAVITGVAGQVGFATAIRLAEQQCRIVGIVRSKEEEAREMFATLPNQELNHLVLFADVTDSSTLEAARSKIDRCDILVNSAGITKNIFPELTDQLTDDIFDSIVTTNLRGTWACIRTFLPLLRATGDSLIVNISSTSAERSGRGNVAYAASKGGVNIMTKTLSRVLAPDGVRIVAVAPGFLKESTSGVQKSSVATEKQAAQVPLGRIGYGDDVASTIEALCTHIRYANGSIILVDGGRTV
jgi:NAD(P)-dependent dehydrogenase (short-subunit alcohol dehydrogenase family)